MKKKTFSKKSFFITQDKTQRRRIDRRGKECFY